MSKESKPSKKSEQVAEPEPYKHHSVGTYNCEAEGDLDPKRPGVIICCMHDPKTGDWKYPKKGDYAEILKDGKK